jgi:hypothetical protein
MRDVCVWGGVPAPAPMVPLGWLARTRGRRGQARATNGPAAARAPSPPPPPAAVRRTPRSPSPRRPSRPNLVDTRGARALLSTPCPGLPTAQVYEPGRGLAFHFDKDEHLLVEAGVMSHPAWSSVLYLTGAAAAGAAREGAQGRGGSGGRPAGSLRGVPPGFGGGRGMRMCMHRLHAIQARQVLGRGQILPLPSPETSPCVTAPWLSSSTGPRQAQRS